MQYHVTYAITYSLCISADLFLCLLSLYFSALNVRNYVFKIDDVQISLHFFVFLPLSHKTKLVSRNWLSEDLRIRVLRHRTVKTSRSVHCCHMCLRMTCHGPQILSQRQLLMPTVRYHGYGYWRVVCNEWQPLFWDSSAVCLVPISLHYDQFAFWDNRICYNISWYWSGKGSSSQDLRRWE